MADEVVQSPDADVDGVGDREQPDAAAVALTGHTVEKQVVTDPRTGKVQAVHQTSVVTDPESDLAVQIPPEADATQQNPLGVHAEPSPNEVAAGAEPTSESVEDIPAYHDAGTANDGSEPESDDNDES